MILSLIGKERAMVCRRRASACFALACAAYSGSEKINRSAQYKKRVRYSSLSGLSSEGKAKNSSVMTSSRWMRRRKSSDQCSVSLLCSTSYAMGSSQCRQHLLFGKRERSCKSVCKGLVSSQSRCRIRQLTRGRSVRT